MHKQIILLIVLVAAGCSDSSHERNYQADLDNLALCFHEAVTVLQTEPETPDDLAMFMQKAKAAVAKSDGSQSDADFSALRWNASGTSLVTTSGQPIRCRVAGQTHDNYGPDGSAWFTEYEFYIAGTDCNSKITIELAMRE